MSLRVGLVGAGNMAASHAPGWEAAGDRVTAVLGSGSTRAAELAARYDAGVVNEYSRLLEAVDVVDICSPTHTHLDYVLAAAAAGKSVVCEKPLARTAADAQLAAGACAGAGVPLLVAHVVRFFPEYATARARVVAGDIGQVAVTRLDRSTYFPIGDGSWFSDFDRSGGVVLDLMIHDVDYARWVAGDIERVFARTATAEGRGGHVLATLRHTSGALSHIQGSWAFPKGVFRTSLEIAGSDGLITLHPARSFDPLVVAADDAADVPEPPTILAESPYVTQIKHFSDVLEGNAEPVVTPADAVAAVAVCEAIAASISAGAPVSLEEGAA